ncbi:MAG: hypothetical protein K1W25_16315 [Lachnospiraceae bacterium]
MKKKLAAVILTAVMTALLLTACGGNKDAEQSASVPETETPAPAADTKTDAPAEGDMVSDENYKILQDNYALITEYAAQVRDIYTSDEIAANSAIEEVILQTEDIINQMGELEQADITEEDAVTLNETMELIIETYDNLLDGMEVAESGEMVSDETFAVLSETYDTLTDIYNTVATAYNDSGAEDEDIKAAMDEAYSFLEQMGEITQDTITEQDAEGLAEAMAAAAEMLEAIAGNL